MTVEALLPEVVEQCCLVDRGPPELLLVDDLVAPASVVRTEILVGLSVFSERLGIADAVGGVRRRPDACGLVVFAGWGYLAGVGVRLDGDRWGRVVRLGEVLARRVGFPVAGGDRLLVVPLTVAVDGGVELGVEEAGGLFEAGLDGSEIRGGAQAELGGVGVGDGAVGFDGGFAVRGGLVMGRCVRVVGLRVGWLIGLV